MRRAAAGEFAGTERFEVRRRLGGGSIGVVYEAFDCVRLQRVALKVLREDAQTLYLVKSQFPVLSRCVHPNLVPLGELIEEQGEWFFTMGLVSGFDVLTYVGGGLRPASLEQSVSITRSDTLLVDVEPVRGTSGSEPHMCDERLLRPIFTQTAVALLALHRVGIVHRNLKPPNILVSAEGRVSVLDYGVLPSEAGGALQPDSYDLRTAAYMAPERAFSSSALPESDWYSFGVLLYEALTGHRPHAGDTQLDLLMNKQEQAPTPPRELDGGVSVELSDLCMDLLSIDPRERPTGYEVLERLGVGADNLAYAEQQVSLAAIGPGSTTFVGRENELHVMRRAFDETRRHGARAVVVVGESGMGKTALMHRFVELTSAEVPGVVVLAGRCYEGQTAQFEAFDEVLEALAKQLRRLAGHEVSVLVPGNAAILTRVFPALARVEALARADAPIRVTRDPHELRLRGFAALRELLGRLGESFPIIIVLDAMQWADADSMTLLEELMRDPDAPSLLWLIGSRTELARVGDAEASSDGEANDKPSRVVLRLGPLDRRAAPELARLLLKRARSDDVDPFAIAVEARGHPLFIDELVRHAVHPDASGASGLRLDDAIWTRAFALPPGARHVLELLCVANAPLGAAQLADAAKLTEVELAGHVALLAKSNLVHRVGAREDALLAPYHDLVAKAVVAHLEEDELADHHERIAIALEGSGAAITRPELLIRHLEAAGEREKATEIAVRTAESATDALAFDRAVELYRTALRLGEPAGEEASQLRIALGDALANAGLGVQSAEVFLQAANDADPAVRLDCQRRAAEQLLASGHIERGIEALGSVLAAYGVKMPRTPRRAVASILWRRALLRISGMRWKPRHASEIRQQDLARIDVFRSVSRGLGLVDNVRATDFQVRGLRLALSTGERTRVGLFLAHEAIYLGSLGVRYSSRAKEILLKVRVIAEEVRDPVVSGWVAAGDGILAYFEGRFSESTRLCAEAEAIFRSMTSGAWWESSSVALFRLYALVRMGVFRKLEKARAKLLRDAAHRNDRYSATTIRRYGGVVWLAKDQPEECLMELEQTEWPLPDAGYHLQHWYELQARGELALYQGEVAARSASFRDGFEQLERSLLTRIEVVRTLSLWLRGRLALSAAACGAAAGHTLADAKRAQRKLARAPLPCHATWAGLLAAGIARQRGDDEAALQHLLTAEELASAHDMPFTTSVIMRRRGEMLGGDEGAALIERADAAMREEGVASPERMCELVAPGFERGA